MLVTLTVSGYSRKTEEMLGTVRCRHESGKVEECLFSTRGEEIKFSAGGIGLPDWSLHQKNEIERRLGLLIQRFKKETFGYPDSNTFVV